MIKEHGFKVIERTGIIDPVYIFPNNLEKLRKKYPLLLTDENIEKASNRAFSKKENLVVIEGEWVRVWVFDGKKYTLTQHKPQLMDGSSTPVTIGEIASINSKNVEAFVFHDDLYGLFQWVDQKIADQTYVCSLEENGINRRARIVQYLSLRMFGKKARELPPEEHWNYGRATLTVESYNEEKK